MRVFLSHRLAEDTPTYGGFHKVELNRSREIERGDTSNNTEFCFAAHTGTHIDAPYHFDAMGKSLDEYQADFWFCSKIALIEYKAQPCEIISLASLMPQLELVAKETNLLLIKTHFEIERDCNPKKYIEQNPGLSVELGVWLRENLHLKMIGFDFISLTSFQDRPLGRDAHMAFLGQAKGEPILIIEDMHLSEIINPPSNVIVLPLIYSKADGSPVTIVADT